MKKSFTVCCALAAITVFTGFKSQVIPVFSLVVAADGNAARYRVREQLAGIDLPNDAVGETKDVSGSIGFDKSGNVIPEASRISVKVDSLMFSGMENCCRIDASDSVVAACSKRGSFSTSATDPAKPSLRR